MTPILARGKRLTSVVTVFAMVATSVVAGVLFAPAAHAALSGVVPRTASVVTSDVLPTVQIDGVAWGQVVVGNTVYVAGKFTTARPAGAAPGVNTTARSNLLAYSLTTGELIQSFNHVLDAQALTVVSSPDGSRIYVGGDFTTVDGVTRKKIAAFSTATGALVSTFAPNVGFQVKAIAATNTTVYIGGSFTGVGVNLRSNIAALQAANGAVTSWNPGADFTVYSLLMTPDQSKLIVGGGFTTLGGVAATGLGALDPTTGARLPWAAEQLIQDSGQNSAITSLSTDGQNIYGTGFRFAGGAGGSTGRLEGTFSAQQDGTLRWVEDCHGDSYSSFATTGIVYVASHAHYCGNIGGHSQTNPFQFQHSMAFTSGATGTIGKDPWGYFNFEGTPSPSILNWFPDLAIGSFTGALQAGWSVAGNSQYVVYGGEFPRVNGIAQQGLVRFAVQPIAPGKDGPVLKGSTFNPTAERRGCRQDQNQFPREL